LSDFRNLAASLSDSTSPAATTPSARTPTAKPSPSLCETLTPRALLPAAATTAHSPAPPADAIAVRASHNEDPLFTLGIEKSQASAALTGPKPSFPLARVRMTSNAPASDDAVATPTNSPLAGSTTTAQHVATELFDFSLAILYTNKTRRRQYIARTCDNQNNQKKKKKNQKKPKETHVA
jgi:hypothetical protein